MKNIFKLIDFGIWGWAVYNLGYATFTNTDINKLTEVTGFNPTWWMLFMVSSLYIHTHLAKKHDN